MTERPGQRSEQKLIFSLQRLPDELLLLIFGNDDLKLRSTAISRRLLPFARLNLYKEVDLFTLRQIYLFARTMRQDQDIADEVKFIGISYKSLSDHQYSAATSGRDSDDSDQSEDDSDNSENDKRSTKTKKSNLDHLALRLDGLSISDITPNVNLEKTVLKEKFLITLFRSLRNLENLLLVGRKLAVVFREGFYRRGVASRLQNVDMRLRAGDDVFSEADGFMLQHAKKLPSLKKFGVEDMLLIGPFTVDKERSWGLEYFKFAYLQSADEIPPLHVGDFARVFKSFSNLLHVDLQFREKDAHLLAAISFLPPTLLGLSVRVGNPNPHPPSPPSTTLKLDNIVQLFPNVRHVRFSGDIYTSKLITSLATLSSLRCVHLEPGCPLFPDELIALVTGGNRSTSGLNLEVHICHECRPVARSPYTKRLPHWETGMSKKEAQKLAKAAKKNGINLSGSVTCALKICDERDGHRCHRASDKERQNWKEE